MVGFSRFLRSSFAHRSLSLRGLSTEPAIAPYRPSKYAVKTTESDPTKHTKQDVGKFYTMPDEVRRRLFDKKILPLYFERLANVFNEMSIIIREPALELIDYLKRANYDHPVIRYVLYGKFGCGKTLTLVHAMNYAWNNDFMIVYVPSVWKWYHWAREVVSVEREPGLLDLPFDGAAWLKHFEMTNGDMLTKLDLRVTETHEWTQREKTEKGAPLRELISFGINRMKFSCQVIDVLLKDLKFHSRTNKSCKIFVAVDGYNGFFQRTSRLKTKEYVRVIPENVSLTKSFLPFVKNDWVNGAVVLVVDDHANVKGDFSSHFPFHLLKKVGVESIDPFIPIHVPEYSPLEFQNYLDYLEEMRWLQKPEGRDEIEFVTQRNPRYINLYCANR